MEKYNIPKNGFNVSNELIYDLRQEGYMPRSIAEVMSDAVSEGKENFITMQATDTRDAIVYDPQGNAKIVLDSKRILEMNYETEYNLSRCCLTLNNEEYEKLTGKNILNLSNERTRLLQPWNIKYKTKESVMDSEEWNFVARTPKNLSDYVEFSISLLERMQGIKFEKSGSFGTRLHYGKGKFNDFFVVRIGSVKVPGISRQDLFNGTNNFTCKRIE